MSALTNRRGFLRGLTTLPLVGGGVTLIGAPSAVAEPVSKAMLATYSEWLRIERDLLHDELFPHIDRASRRYLVVNGACYADRFFIPPPPASYLDLPQPSTRAALVLSAIGCDWRGGSTRA